MKFSDMPYSRPDMEAVKAEMTRLTGILEGAGSFEEADAAFGEMDKLTERIETLASLVYIRHQINTADAFYSAETEFFDEAQPETEEYVQKWTLALIGSRFRPEFEKKYGKLLLSDSEMALKTFSPEIIPDLQRENALVTEYDKLIASAAIDFKGGVYTVAQMGPFTQDTDAAVRREAWQAVGGFYKSAGAELDRIFDELVKVRTAMAKKLGFSSFTELGYLRMTRNSYGREDIERFREGVVRDIVPLADRIYRDQAERIGAQYPLTFDDAALMFPTGNAKPCGTADDILENGRRFYRELSPETAEFIDFMYENGLLDVLARTGKAAGGFCTDLPQYRSPFIFANFNGTAGDVEVITHEAGHAFAAYCARDIFPSELRSPTVDACEIHSMTMEFFAWPWAESFFGKDTAKFLYGHLTGALTFIPYGTMVDHFQHIIYDNPDMSPDERHAEWRRLMGVYTPWLRLDDLPFYGEGRHWQRQIHIYQAPFYYIDYCMAQSVALQFWALMQRDREEAWKSYKELLSIAGTRTFSELVEGAGLPSPFDPESFRDICLEAERWLSEADPKQLV